MSARQILYLSKADVERAALDILEILHLLEQAFVEKAGGRVEMPPKLGIHTRPDAFSHAMPAYIPAMHAAGVKWISAYPENYKLGLPYISGLIILSDEESGLPYAVMDGAWITAYRTAAATALSARFLARPQSKVVGILGCGVQGRSNLEALAATFPVERAFAYDIQPQVRERYCLEMRAKLGIEVVGVSTPKEAVVQSDLVVTATPIQKHPIPTIEQDWLQPGAFASSVDFASYWSAASLQQMDKIATDDLPQYHQYQSSGYFEHAPHPYADLSELVTRQKPGRETPEERTLAVNLGMAMEDIVVAVEVYRRARQQGLGTWLDL
jgi:ornithine cyclodeaminase/alanine dehydrogenase-like protein (mu-crystallin family)